MTNWQSPRARRDSTNDPEAYGKGGVQMPTTRADDNTHAWEIADESDYKQKYEAEGHTPRKRI